MTGNWLGIYGISSATPQSAREDDWRVQAACARVDPELFFPTELDMKNTGRQTRQAIMICLECPVLAQCRQWTIASFYPDGIAGGWTPNQRANHHRRARRPTRAVS